MPIPTPTAAGTRKPNLQYMKKKKLFFLKRWTFKFFTWLDELLFGGRATDDHASAATPFWITVVINFWLGMIVIGCSLFMDSGSRDDINTIGAGVGLASVLGVTAWYLIGSLRYFPSTGIKIFRSLYVLVLCGIGFAVGFYSAIIFSFVLIGLFVLMVLYHIVFDTTKSGNIILDDGTEIKREKGLCGEDYYSDRNGREYDRSGDTFYQK